MAIHPPSDIVLDVASAADPAQVRAATARLAKLAADPAAVDAAFGKALSAARTDGKPASPEAASLDPTTRSTSADVATLKRGLTKKADVYQKFESVLLQNFVEEMLPKDAELFGDQTSAGAYRSMMAEQLAAQIAKAGGIGIAKAVEHAHPANAAPPPAAAAKA